ncbi:hypothetical protein CPB84DRAFT_1857271 [Gymnopilus junonius]|uniref:Uncharacterized protein n=1 Tax=Gymnopilus junonius TaxID=109634 RepID=A0A9P5N6M2_GYMJU|nr:hypothetical protein CPB84DRAFT_1857271 [Gymnopilus junonius]
MYCKFPSILTHNPDNILALENLSDITPQVVFNAPVETNACLSLIVDEGQTPTPVTTAPSYLPFANSTIFSLMNWMWLGSAMKSIGEMTKLITFLKSNKFKKEDLDSFNIHKETAKFDASLEASAQLAEGLTGAPNS